MLFIDGKCPYCNEKRGFNFFAVSNYISQRDAVDIARNAPIRDNQKKIARHYACGTCLLCKAPVIMGLEIQDEFLRSMRDCITNPDRDYNGPMPTILSVLPKPEEPYTHPTFPPDVNKLFRDLQDMLKQKLAPSLVIMGCRSVLEGAAKELGGEGKNLYSRIEHLKGKAIVNGVLADWAHSIRELGNGAAHELEGTQAEANELVEFTKLFLQYTFEFPARVEALRTRKTTTP